MAIEAPYEERHEMLAHLPRLISQEMERDRRMATALVEHLSARHRSNS